MTRSTTRALRPLLLAALLTTPAAAQPGAESLRDDIAFARRKVYPALVNITVVARQFSGGRSHRGPGAGSGVIVSPAGHVLTNFHVAGHTTRITCRLPDGEAVDADVVVHDPLTDLSVLKLRLEQRDDPNRPLPFATLGASSELEVGQYVLAMGNPLSLSSSLTLGVVSNTGRVFTNFTGTDMEELDLGDGEKTGLFTRWIQHDALILPGNSGGPLVNLRGEVVGINELGGSGMGFAIPSDLCAHVLNQALSHGEVRRGWLGFSVLPVEKVGREDGALVSSVIPSSPADEAGLEAGDVLLRLAGEPVAVRFFEQVPELYQEVAQLAPGAAVGLLVERDGERVELTAEVVRMEEFLGEEAELPAYGLTVRAITGPYALTHRYPGTDGVVVTGLRPGHPFEEARPRLRAGDVITSVADREVTGLADLRQALEEAAGEEQVVVAFRRDLQRILTLVEPPREDEERRGGELPSAWLGVRSQVLTAELGQELGLEGLRGFRITQVLPWTKAEAAGLQAGDVIVSVDGEELEAYRERDSQELRLLVEQMPIGEAVPVTVVRDGQRRQLEVVMEPNPTAASDVDTAEVEPLEFAVREVTFMDRVEHRWPEDQEGVIVTEATMGGWANMAGLRIDDLIVQVGEAPVHDVESFEAVIDRALEEQPRALRLFVRRKHRTTFVFIEPDWESLPAAGDR